MIEKGLSEKDKEIIEQVAATMAISGMPLTEQSYKNLCDIESGRKTKEQVSKEIFEKYSHI